MAVAAVLFSGMNFLARLATQSASWASVATVRALVGALVAFTVARIRGSSLKVNDRRMLLGRSALGTTSMLATFYALSARSLSLGNTVTLLNLAPIFLALLAPIFLRERTSRLVGTATVVALTGVVLIVRPSFLFGDDRAASLAIATGPSANVTAAVAVFGALSTAMAMMFLRRVGRTETSESVAFHFSLIAACTLSVFALFDLRMPSPRDMVLMLASGVCAGLAQLAMTRAYAMENAARVGGMSYLAVVVSAGLGIGLLGERPGPTALVGSVLVVIGGVLLTIPRPFRA
jgi:drug/metabolite transporter (DMT)-like permease